MGVCVFKNRVSVFFVWWMILLFSKAVALPRVIDFGKFLPIEDSRRVYDELQWELGCYAFNIAPEITPVFSFLAKQYKIETAVETGTCQGNTTIALARLIDKVHTIEIVEDQYCKAKNKLKQISNIICHLGSSEKVLKDLLPSLSNQRVLFYLDAHWESYWPLLDELEEISSTHRDNCIIIIDDFKVPGRRDIYYDAYGGAECSIEYIKKQLDKVFTDYTYHYLIPKSVWSRAKFIAIPIHWRSE